jgi:hypothetical protein
MPLPTDPLYATVLANDSDSKQIIGNHKTENVCNLG